MITKNYNITVDFEKGYVSAPHMSFVQGDANGGTFTFLFKQTLTTEQIFVTFVVPNALPEMHEVIGGKLTIETGILASAGKVDCQIALYQDTVRLTNPITFSFVVVADLSAGVIEASEKLPILLELINSGMVSNETIANAISVFNSEADMVLQSKADEVSLNLNTLLDMEENEDTRLSNEVTRVANDLTRPIYVYKTQAEYDALTLEEKEDPKYIYEITDGDDTYPSELEAIVDAVMSAKQVYDDALMSDTNLEVIEARGTSANLGDRLNATDAQLTQLVTYDAKKYNSLREMFSTITSGGYVKIPIGIYNESYIVLNGLSDLIIDGNGFLSKIKFNDLLSTLDGAEYHKNGEGVHFVIHNCVNIKFKNFAVEGVYDNRITGGYSHGVVVSGASDEIYFENINLSKICGEGVLNNSNGTVYVNDCIIKNIRNSSIGSVKNTSKIVGRRNIIKDVCYQTNVGGISVNAEWDFQDNYIETKQVGVKVGHLDKTGKGKLINNKFIFTGTLTTQNCFSLEECNDMVINDNYIEGYYYGINGSAWTVGDNLKIRRNKFKNISNNVLTSFLNKTNIVIEDNEIDGGVDGILLNKAISYSSIKRNIIKNITGKGINILSTSLAEESHSNEISGNKITGGTYGIYIGGRNYKNIIRNDNVFIGQSIQDIYVDLSNTYFASVGNVIEYNFATTPILDGVADNSNQTPSLNKGNLYILPSGSAGNLYNIVRFDNVYVGQVVSFLAVDAYSVFKNGNNISLSADVPTVAGKVYTFKGIANGGVLKYYLTSVN